MEAEAEAADMFNSVEDDEREAEATTMFEQVDQNVESSYGHVSGNRPDRTDAAEAEQVAFSKALNG